MSAFPVGLVIGLEEHPLSELGFRPGVLGPQPLMAVPDCCFASKKPCSQPLLICFSALLRNGGWSPAARGK